WTYESRLVTACAFSASSQRSGAAARVLRSSSSARRLGRSRTASTDVSVTSSARWASSGSVPATGHQGTAWLRAGIQSVDGAADGGGDRTGGGGGRDLRADPRQGAGRRRGSVRRDLPRLPAAAAPVP